MHLWWSWNVPDLQYPRSAICTFFQQLNAFWIESRLRLWVGSYRQNDRHSSGWRVRTCRLLDCLRWLFWRGNLVPWSLNMGVYDNPRRFVSIDCFVIIRDVLLGYGQEYGEQRCAGAWQEGQSSSWEGRLSGKWGTFPQLVQTGWRSPHQNLRRLAVEVLPQPSVSLQVSSRTSTVSIAWE